MLKLLKKIKYIFVNFWDKLSVLECPECERIITDREIMKCWTFASGDYR